MVCDKRVDGLAAGTQKRFPAFSHVPRALVGGPTDGTAEIVTNRI